MKHLRKSICILLVLAALMGLCTVAFAAKSFEYDDYAPTDWFYRYVEKATDAGWMNGTGEGKFNPNGILNRAMFVTILHRMAGTPAATKAASFSDVQKGAWYENAVAWAAENGVVTGYADGRFGVTDPLTREQMAAILYRWAGKQGKDVSGRGDLTAFTDKASVSSYAADAFAWAVDAGIITGSNNALSPKGTSTRAQAATVLVRFDAAEEAAALTRADLEKAVVETAWAYFLKGTKIQYDSESITDPILSKYYSGSYRLTEDAAPEYGSSDTTIFSVCSDYCQKVYYNALNERMLGLPLDWTTNCLLRYSHSTYGKKNTSVAAYIKDKSIAANYENTMDPAEMKSFLQNWKENLRPGDVIVPTGHAMLYMGDGFVTDCWGSKYSMATGEDAYEAKGGVSFLHTVEDLYVEGDDPICGSVYLPSDSLTYFLVYRPLNAIVEDDGDGDKGNDRAAAGTSVSAATRSRLKYPGLEIDRTVDITPFGTAVSGGTLTYSVNITNHTNSASYIRQNKTPADYKGLKVTEQIPAGTEFVSATEGGTLKDGVITWTVDAAAGETRELAYTIKVTAGAGEDIVSGGGWVDDIPSNTIVNRVGGEKFSAEDQAVLTEFYHRYNQDWLKTYGFNITDDTSAAEEIYAKVLGKKLELPNAQTLFTRLFEQVHIDLAEGPGTSRGTPYEAWLYTLKDDAYKNEPMLVRSYLGGKSTWFGSDQERINEFSADYLEPGDIILHMELSEYTKTAAERKVTGVKTFVWLGDGNYAMYDTSAKQFSHGRDHKELWKGFISDVFFVLRPSQAGIPAASGQQVKPAEPVNYQAETRQQRQQAVVATAKAFLNKGEKLQYDQIALSKVATSSGGNVRNQYFAAPEAATSQKDWYGSIQALILSIYRDALGFRIAPTSTAATYSRVGGLADEYTQVYTWTAAYDGSAIPAAEILSMLEPGDVLAAIQSKNNYIYGMYLGDGQLMTYAVTARYDLTNGVENREAGGAASVVQLKDVLTDAFLYYATEAHIIRFVESEGYDLACITPQARSRIRYPEMVIDRTVDVGPYGMAVQGDRLTYTVTVENKSSAAYKGLTVTETVPEGTELLTAQGAKNDSGKLAWEIDVPAGGSKTVSYTVTVTGNAGEKIVCDGGAVAEIPSNSLTTVIGKDRFSAESLARMQELSQLNGQQISDKLALADKKTLDDIRVLYAYILGGKTDISTELINAVFGTTAMTEYYQASGKNALGLYTLSEAAMKKGVGKSMVSGYYGGQEIHVDNVLDRLMELRTDHLMPGDVLMKLDKSVVTYALHLGDGKFIVNNTGNGPEVPVTVMGEEALTDCFKNTYKFFMVIRPLQAYTAAALTGTK